MKIVSNSRETVVRPLTCECLVRYFYHSTGNMSSKVQEMVIVDEVDEVQEGKVYQWGHWNILIKHGHTCIRTDEVEITLSEPNSYFMINDELIMVLPHAGVDVQSDSYVCSIVRSFLRKKIHPEAVLVPVFTEPSEKFTLSASSWDLTSKVEGKLNITNDGQHFMLKKFSHDIHVTNCGLKASFFVQK